MNSRRMKIGTGIAASFVLLVASQSFAGPNEAPHFYSGYIEDNGLPLDGTANVVLRIWDDAVAAEPVNLVCLTDAPTTVVVEGRFSIPLNPACDGMAAANVLHLEVEVDGALLPRTQVGRLPFAGAAAVAEAAAGPLAARLDDVEIAATDALEAASLGLQASDLGPILLVQAFELNSGTTVRGALIQNVLQGSCPPGQVFDAISSDGTFNCVALPVDFGSALQDLNPSTTIGLAQIQRASTGGCPLGQALDTINPDGSFNCVLLPIDFGIANQDLNPSTTIGLAQIQRASTGGCPLGQVLDTINPDGSFNCAFLPVDYSIANQDLNPSTTIEGLQIQRASIGGCSPGDVLDTINSDGTFNCVLLPVDYSLALQDLNPSTTIGGAQVQRQVSGSCIAGEAYRQINGDGTFVCERIPRDLETFGGDLLGTTTIASQPIQRGLTNGCPPGLFLTSFLPDGTATCESPNGISTFTVGGGHSDFADVNTAMSVLAGLLPPPSATNPMVLNVRPGLYPGFAGIPHVSIVGSGVGVTIFEDAGVAVTLDGGSLSHATVRVNDFAPSTGIEVFGSTELNHVLVDVDPFSGGGVCIGISLVAAGLDVTMYDTTVSVLSVGCSEGTGLQGFSGGDSVFDLERMEVFALDRVINTNGGDVDCTECKLSSNGSADPALDVGSGTAVLMRSKLIVTGLADGITIAAGSSYSVLHSTIEVQGPSANAVEAFLAGTIIIRHSELIAQANNALEFDVAATGEMLWTTMTGQLFSDFPQRCLYNINGGGVEPCG